MFASGDNKISEEKDQGSVILLAMIISIIMGIFVGSLTMRFNNIIKNQASLEYKRNLVDWGKAVSERIDCLRMMDPYTGSNACPSGTTRPLMFFNEPQLTASGPESSYPLGKGWFAQVTCGTTDLRIKLARYVNGNYDRDPLSGRILDFANGASQVSDGGHEVPMCPSYFGNGQPAVRVLGMSIATQQKLRVERKLSPVTQTITFMTSECDGRIGVAEELDDIPLRTIYRLGGASAPANAPRSIYADWFYGLWRSSFNSWGQTGNLQPDWILTSPRYLGTHQRASCMGICSDAGMNTGLMTKCDRTAPADDPPLGTTRWDDTSPQVNCLCIN